LSHLRGAAKLLGCVRHVRLIDSVRRSSALLSLAVVAAACQFPGYQLDEGGPATNGGSAGAAPNVPGSGGVMAAPLDPCSENPCQHAGRCVATLAGSTVCICEPGYRGDFCEAEFDNCEPDPCVNGGVCFDGDNAAFCMCPEGYDGATCEHDHDDCADDPCLNGGVCTDGFMSRTCSCSPGFAGESCEGALLSSCREIQDLAPDALDGVYAVDPDGAGQGNPPLDVFCDMQGGGWTLVGQERKGDAGTLKFLGISSGDADALASSSGSGLIGEHFKGLYEEVWIAWWNDDVSEGSYFRVNEEMFSNTVRLAMPVSEFWTSDDQLQDWVNAAGGAVLCRGSQSPDVRPGDSSWAIKPQDDTNTLCGCNSQGWTGRGAFYGGHSDQTQCNPSGGGWSAVTADGGAKGNVTDWWLQIWVR
jgi:hypothetical protein